MVRHFIPHTKRHKGFAQRNALRFIVDKKSKSIKRYIILLFFIHYKAEGVPLGESLMSFCMRNKVSYHL